MKIVGGQDTECGINGQCTDTKPGFDRRLYPEQDGGGVEHSPGNICLVCAFQTKVATDSTATLPRWQAA